MRKSTNKNNTKKVTENKVLEMQEIKDVTKNENISDKENKIEEVISNVTEEKSVTENKKTPKEEISTWDKKFRYQMLDRMRQDCDYYLNGHDTVNQLYADSEAEQIEYMLALWDSFDDRDKPRWLSREDIVEYAKKMGVEI